jgi:hypothetical protein
MGFAQRIVFLFFCVSLAFGQRIPQSFFEPVEVIVDQHNRIQALDTIVEKSELQLKELAMLYAETKAYEESFEIFEQLVESHPEEFEYQYLLGGISGILASEVPRMKSLPYVRTMKDAFEQATRIKPDALEVQLALLELYTELPWVLGGSNKKAEKTLESIKSISTIEGFLAEGYFYRVTKKNKEALVAYLNAVNEVRSCEGSINATNNAYYHLAVCTYYLQKDVLKATCFFRNYLANHDAGDAYPKSFANYYLEKISNPEAFDDEVETILIEYDKLTSWIQNNFK